MSKLEKFLKESSLSDDAKALIQEAWDEEKKYVASAIRQEMKSRYEADRLAIVEGLNEVAKDVISEELVKFTAERKKLSEDRAVVRASLAKFSDFAKSRLAEEVKDQRKERKAIAESLGKFAEFSNTLIAEELTEFHKDKQDLVETKVKLVAESKRKLNETKAQWVKAASAEAEKFVTESINSEFKQLHSELKEAKENMFGRKLFEAFSSEFKNTLFNSNKEFKSVLNALNEAKSRELKLKEELNETKQNLQDAKTRQMVTEDIYKRDAMLKDLMRPLTAQQKVVMEGLLEKTSTAKLKEDFHKYLKPVLNETPSAPKKKVQKAVISECTGNRKELINESANTEDTEFDNLLRDIEKNAGI